MGMDNVTPKPGNVHAAFKASEEESLDSSASKSQETSEKLSQSQSDEIRNDIFIRPLS